MQTSANHSLPLAFGMQSGPKDAPAKVVRQIESEAQALAVSMSAGGLKQSYVAAAIGKSDAYLSQMRNGRRPIPRKLVGPLCAATGSNLLRQFIEMQAALDGGVDEIQRLADLMRAA